MRRVLVAFLAVLWTAPPAGAAPAVCASPCEVAVYSVAYVPPVTVVPSGREVRWRTGDGSHPTADLGSAPECFRVPVGHGVDSVPVRFDVDGDSLVATSEGTSAPCANARRTEAGFALPYHCLLHAWMVATIVVQP